MKNKTWRDVGDWGQSVFQFGGDDTVYACKGTDLRVLTDIFSNKTLIDLQSILKEG